MKCNAIIVFYSLESFFKHNTGRTFQRSIQPGLIHHFLHKKMHVPSQEYDSCYPKDQRERC